MHALGGDYSGHYFLVVDYNNDEHYNANSDFLMDITATNNLGDFGLGNFT